MFVKMGLNLPLVKHFEIFITMTPIEERNILLALRRRKEEKCSFMIMHLRNGTQVRIITDNTNSVFSSKFSLALHLASLNTQCNSC